MNDSEEVSTPRDDVHGGLDEAEVRALGLDPETILDFSVNVNPFGPSPRVRERILECDPARYPDRHGVSLRRALGALNQVAVERVLTGNGTAELIWLAAQAWLRPGRPALVIGPTFGEYARAGRAAGALVEILPAAPPDFVPALDQILAAIKAQRPAVVFLCNPNNPTGQQMPECDVRRIAEACGNGLLILDEAYRAFAGQPPFGPPPLPNVLVLRSMTKDFALAGLRLGYALGEPRLLSAMRAYQAPWSVNGPAQAAGLAALEDGPHLTRTLALTRAAAAALASAISGLGAPVVPTHTHFFLVKVGDGRAWRERLLRRGCLLRDCASFGLPAYVRVSARRPEENETLIRAWARAKQELSVDKT